MGSTLLLTPITRRFHRANETISIEGLHALPTRAVKRLSHTTRVVGVGTVKWTNRKRIMCQRQLSIIRSSSVLSGEIRRAINAYLRHVYFGQWIGPGMSVQSGSCCRIPSWVVFLGDEKFLACQLNRFTERAPAVALQPGHAGFKWVQGLMSPPPEPKEGLQLTL